MALGFRLPEWYKPEEVLPFKDCQYGRDQQWWIYCDRGRSKTYDRATPEETLQWARKLFSELKISDSQLGLLVARGTLLDNCLGMAVHKHRDLFGGPEVWEKLQDWERARGKELPEGDKK